MKINGVFLAILLTVTGVSYFLAVYLRLPYRVYNSDIFHQMAILNEFDRGRITEIGDPYFRGGPVDLHAGPYYLVLFVMSELLGKSVYQTLPAAVVINIFVFMLALYFFGSSFGLKQYQIPLFVLLCLLSWGSFNFFFAGLFEMTNLLVTGSFPAVIGLIYILVILGVLKQYLTTERPAYLGLAVILSTMLLLSHLLSGVIVDSFILVLLAAELWEKKRIERKTVWAVLVIPVSILLSLGVWPLFNFLTLLTSAKTVEVGESESVVENLFAFKYWVLIAGSQLIGLVFGLKVFKAKKQLFIPLMLIFSVIMTLSYLLPIRVTLYWRYFPFILIGLSALLAGNVFKMNKRIAMLLVSVLITAGVINIAMRINHLTGFDYFAENYLAEVMRQVEKRKVVLSDPNTSYHLTSLYQVDVVGVSYNHANPAYIPESKKRYEELMDFLTTEKTTEEQTAFLKRYEVDYVLVNKNFVPDYIGLLPRMDFADRFELKVPNRVIAVSQDYVLYQLTDRMER